MNPRSFDSLWASYWLDVQKIGPLTHSRFRLLLSEVPTVLPPNPKVIDVGCGSGAFLGMFLSKFPDADVQGIEVSMEAYKAAPAALQRRILVGDIFELESELPRGLVDLVVCSEVLEHVRDPAAFLGVLRDLLKPGGSLLLTVPAGMAHWSVQDEVAGHLRRFEYEEFSDLLRQQGLVVERQYTWGGPVGTLYNRLISGIGPERAANAADTLLVQVLAWAMRLAMRLDDLFKSTKRFQLIARASRPIEQ